jgi:hypothetical protein
MEKDAALATFAKSLGPAIAKRVRSVPVSRILDYLMTAGRTVKEIAKRPTGPKQPLGKRIRSFFFSPRAMLGKHIREAGKQFVKSPGKAVKAGLAQMRPKKGEIPWEPLFMGALTAETLRDMGGKLGPGETRAGRIGSGLGALTGYAITPVKKVGILGNILAGDIIGAGAGRLAGRGTAALAGAGERMGKSLAQKLQEKGKKHVRR